MIKHRKIRSDKYDKTQKNIEKTNYKNASGNKTGSALNRKYAGAA